MFLSLQHYRKITAQSGEILFFYSEVIFLSRNMDLNNKSNESVADQRCLKYCLLLKTQVYFGLSFCSFFNTSIFFVTCMPSDLHRWQFRCITSDVFIWPTSHWQILFHRWGNRRREGKKVTGTLRWLDGNTAETTTDLFWLLIKFSLLPSKPSSFWYDFKMPR